MIRINLVKERRDKPSFRMPFPVGKPTAVKGLPKGVLPYAALLLWTVPVLLFLYHLHISRRLEEEERELQDLRVQKQFLQAKAKKLSEEKKMLEERIKTLEKSLKDVEDSKDILMGLKGYYLSFNNTMRHLLDYMPPTLYVNSYQQNLDMATGLIKAEVSVESLDYSSIGSYTRRVSQSNRSLLVNQMERKVNPYGFEYYTAKIAVETEGR
ncbi:hypothetical protein Thal_0047 [Thermocrinis albus DSM 14484]|uniref:Fimbrial assembly family protein n=1 Tax=Thermocrinis albus (strain DSM 14484 / JCM 11386 / HI 11/12) TaxID=638303 RepID=D3SNE8_THEAH|nr:hypothetical protein [Thermocrinis albus]ADC88685.1 hypothetical protein Thal_0047 [Thermocrinis albus DSM 14484]